MMNLVRDGFRVGFYGRYQSYRVSNGTVTRLDIAGLPHSRNQTVPDTMKLEILNEGDKIFVKQEIKIILRVDFKLNKLNSLFELFFDYLNLVRRRIFLQNCCNSKY